MKLICAGLDLSDAVMKVIKAASVKAANPILEGIKLKAEDDTLILTATDLELAIEKRIKADVKIEGETVVPGKLFADFVKKIVNENIEMTLNDNMQLRLKYTESDGVFQCFNAAEFPALKVIEDAQNFSIVKKEFRDLINKTVFSAASDEARPILKGILLEVDDIVLTAVALDGFRMALCNKPVENSTAKMSAVVPAKSLFEIGKLLDDSEEFVTVNIRKNYLMVEIEGTKVVTRLLEGDFVNYKQVIPKGFTTTATINTVHLADALERASLLARGDKNNLVKFDIRDNMLTATSNSELGNLREKMPAGVDGVDIAIAFNVKYFLDALNVIDDEFIKIQFISPVSPCIVTGLQKEYEYIYLILPMRLM